MEEKIKHLCPRCRQRNTFNEICGICKAKKVDINSRKSPYTKNMREYLFKGRGKRG